MMANHDSEHRSLNPALFPNFVDNQGNLRPEAEFLNILIIGPPIGIGITGDTTDVGHRIENLFEQRREEFDLYTAEVSQGRSKTVEYWQEQLERLKQYRGLNDQATLHSVLEYIANSNISILSGNDELAEEEVASTQTTEMPSGAILKPIDRGDRVELISINDDPQKLLDREHSLALLKGVFSNSQTIRIPEVINRTDKSVIVEKAKGVNLLTASSPEFFATIGELPVELRKQFLIDLFEGVDALNKMDYVFGDYNEAGFCFDIDEKKLWIVDPGNGEHGNGELSPENLRGRKALAIDFELNSILDNAAGSIDSMFNIFGLPCSMKEIKSLHRDGKIKSAADIAMYIRQAHF